MSQTRDGIRVETRGERKERTRRAILDAALELCEDSSLIALSLRQVAKEVGIVPTAFYRHFDSIESLGLELVDESFVSLRAMLRDIRRGDPRYADVVDLSVRVLVDHVHQHRGHFLFITRERVAGPPGVREAIRHEIEQCERELAADLARLADTEAWSGRDWQILAGLFVTTMVATAESLIFAAADGESDLELVARTRLRMVLVGALNWHSRERSGREVSPPTG